MSAEELTSSPELGEPERELTGGPVVIEVRDLEKTFHVPKQRVDSLKERVLHPLRKADHKDLHALDRVSFDVHRGEFFGIVGRNGSGKSTLLKVLASIYRADAGTIRMAGRLTPFIELGVGFNLDLTARENVVLNGVMMGLTPRETRRRLDAVLDFAELDEFIDLRLKNYSSGMLVRLAFSTMIQADADVMLIDEVLAVGDAAFQQKCADVFNDLRERKTIVFVTHDTNAVKQYCHRAMLIHDGKVVRIGDPGEIARLYLRLNFEDAGAEGAGNLSVEEDAELLDAWLENDAGERVTSLEHGERIRLHAELEVRREVPEPRVGFLIANGSGVPIYQFGTEIDGVDEHGVLPAGRRVRVSASLDNPLAAGRYHVALGVSRRSNDRDVVLYEPHATSFVVFGGPSFEGVVTLEHEIEAHGEEGR
jgi:ABC-2 type transport system ATP-binding protein